MKKLASIALACAAALAARGAEVPSDTIGLVQFISGPGASDRKFAATPGQIYATEALDAGGNRVASLTVGSPSGERVPICDPFALRRRVAEFAAPGEYYIECGENTRQIGENTVRLWENEIIPAWDTGGGPPAPGTDRPKYTRMFMVRPVNPSQMIMSLKDTKSEVSTMASSLMNNNFADVRVTTVGGVAYVEASFRAFENNPIVVTRLDISISEIVRSNSWQGEDRLVDDFTDHIRDYYFRDGYGRTSLGGLRKWIHDTYDVYRADNWASYPATNTVNLSGQAVNFTRNARITTETVEAVNDTQVWRVGSGQVALRVHAGFEGENTNGLFRILQIDVSSSSEYDYIWTSIDNISTPPFANMCFSLTDPNWIRPEGQVTELGQYEGEPAYCIAIPKAAHEGQRSVFYRAHSDNGLVTASYLYTEFTFYAKRGVAIQSPNGKWWTIQVDNGGNLSAAETTPPAGVDDF